MMKWRASVIAIPSRIVPNSAAATACKVGPYARTDAPNSNPTRASMSGYCLEIGLWHQRHLPRSQSHENRGMLSRQAIGCLQFGHVERGVSNDWSRGNRRMQTLRKLPKHKPSSTAPRMMTTLAPTHHLAEQDAGGHRAIERFRAARQGNRDALRRDASGLGSDPGALVPDGQGNQPVFLSCGPG